VTDEERAALEKRGTSDLLDKFLDIAQRTKGAGVWEELFRRLSMGNETDYNFGDPTMPFSEAQQAIIDVAQATMLQYLIDIADHSAGAGVWLELFSEMYGMIAPEGD